MKKCLITVIIILVSSTNSAFCLPALPNLSNETQKQVFEYPIKRESFKELVQLHDKFLEIVEDFESLSSKDAKNESCDDVLANALLRIFQAEMNEAYMVTINMFGLEIGHGNANQFNPVAIRDIIVAIEMYIPSFGGRVERINETITMFTDNNLVIILCEKLKEHNREAKRLMQKIVDELKITIELIKANESNP